MGIINSISISNGGGGEWHTTSPSDVTNKVLTFLLPYMPSNWFVFHTYQTQVEKNNVCVYIGKVNDGYYAWGVRLNSASNLSVATETPTVEYANGTFTITIPTFSFFSNHPEFYTLVYI